MDLCVNLKRYHKLFFCLQRHSYLDGRRLCVCMSVVTAAKKLDSFWRVQISENQLALASKLS